MNHNDIEARRAYAREAGMPTYEGRACDRGHTLRRVADNRCLECRRRRDRKRSKRRYYTQPERREDARLRSRAYVEAWRTLARRYQDEFRAIYSAEKSRLRAA